MSYTEGSINYINQELQIILAEARFVWEEGAQYCDEVDAWNLKDYPEHDWCRYTWEEYEGDCTQCGHAHTEDARRDVANEMEFLQEQYLALVKQLNSRDLEEGDYIYTQEELEKAGQLKLM